MGASVGERERAACSLGGLRATFALPRLSLTRMGSGGGRKPEEKGGHAGPLVGTVRSVRHASARISPRLSRTNHPRDSSCKARKAISALVRSWRFNRRKTPVRHESAKEWESHPS